MAAKKKTKKATTDSSFEASVITFGKTFQATGETVSEAISKLQPGNIKGRSVITLVKGDKRKERIIQPMATARLFNSGGLTREVAIKNVALLFQGFDA